MSFLRYVDIMQSWHSQVCLWPLAFDGLWNFKPHFNKSLHLIHKINQFSGLMVLQRCSNYFENILKQILTTFWTIFIHVTRQPFLQNKNVLSSILHDLHIILAAWFVFLNYLVLTTFYIVYIINFIWNLSWTFYFTRTSISCMRDL